MLRIHTLMGYVKLSFPHVNHLNHVGTSLSGNLLFKYFMDARMYQSGMTMRKIYVTLVKQIFKVQ